jgi:hypothetical protein
MFNTLKYAKMLEEAGFSREQAETSIKILVEIMEDKLATKHDVADLKSTMATMATKHDVLQFKHELTLKIGTMLSAAVTLIVALVTVIHKFI